MSVPFGTHGQSKGWRTFCVTKGKKSQNQPARRQRYTGMSEAPRGLNAGAGGADKFAQGGDVGAVGADAAGVHGEAEIFGLLDAEAGVVEFGEAVAFGRREPVAARAVHGAQRAMIVPALAHDIEEVVPISPVPHGVLPHVPVQAIGCRRGAMGSMKIGAARLNSPNPLQVHEPGDFNPERCRKSRVNVACIL